MQEKKQRLGALASPSGRVHSLTEDFLEAFVSDLYFVSVFLITSSKSDWLSSFNHRRLSSSMCVYVSPSEFSKFPRRVHSGPDPTIVAQLQRTLYNPSTYSSSISFFISIRSISTFLQDIHSHHHQTFGPTFIHWIVQRDRMHLKIVLGRILLAEKTFKCIPRKWPQWHWHHKSQFPRQAVSWLFYLTFNQHHQHQLLIPRER